MINRYLNSLVSTVCAVNFAKAALMDSAVTSSSLQQMDLTELCKDFLQFLQTCEIHPYNNPFLIVCSCIVLAATNFHRRSAWGKAPW